MKKTILLLALIVGTANAQTYGPELVTNGTFDTEDAWTLGYSWQILPAPGALAFHNEGYTAALYQPIDLAPGNTYRITYTVSGSAGSTNPYTRARIIGTVTANCPYQYGDGTFTCTTTAPAGATAVAIWPSSGFGGVLDDVSVREVLSGNP